MIKNELEDKMHFINFLNDKIKNGIENKVLRKISNIYLKHSMKKDHKMRMELDQLEVTGGARGNVPEGIKGNGLNSINGDIIN